MLKYQYSGLEQTFHKLVLGSKFIQTTSFDLQQLLSPNLKNPEQPVFVVGMARSGTTTLLNLLFESGQFESSRYSDLPFPLIPSIWRKILKKFSNAQTAIERAHGDGITITPNSPEAFEEVFWSNIGNHLHGEELHQAFCNYISSICSADGVKKRYISKNNNNITRLSFLVEVCQKLNGIIVIPIRNPIKTAISSLRMHQRFSRMQMENQFVLEYMNMIGHREFGQGLQWLQVGERPFKPNYSVNDFECWLEYWIYLHNGLINWKNVNYVYFLDFDDLRNNPSCKTKELYQLCNVTGYAESISALLIRDSTGNSKETELECLGRIQQAELILKNLLNK